MEASCVPASDPAYIERKRNELKAFYASANFPQHELDKIIENELKPLIDGEMNKDRPYIAASALGPVKSEYEVMAGQPFTKVEDDTVPLTAEKTKEIIKNNPVIAEKAKQIQIVMNSHSYNNDIVVPMNQIKVSNYTDMKAELDSAEGNTDKIKRIKYRNMQTLMNAAAGCKKNSTAEDKQTVEEEIDNHESSEDEEFERIDTAITKYTNKSYETRYQETKEMLNQLADTFEDPDNIQNMQDKPSKLPMEEHPALKEASSCIIKGRRQTSGFDEIIESYAINKVLNISLKENRITLDLSGNLKDDKDNNEQDKDIVFPKSFEVKLKDTENALKEIDFILTNDYDEIHLNESNVSDVFESADEDELPVENKDVKLIQQSNKAKFDEKMETSLQNTLHAISEFENNASKENNELEFKEMKTIAQNIVEGAECLKTFIKEDITNKLNSMNELLNDVNTALENSRKSNIAYLKMKEGGEVKKRVKEIETCRVGELQGDVHRNIITDDNDKGNVTLLEIDGIHTAITKLNDEIKCHENRINKSKENYEMRNQECQDFIKEVDDVLNKSQKILHPKAPNIRNNILESESEGSDTKSAEPLKEGAIKRKELWDIDILCKDNTNKKLSDFEQQECARKERIDHLLYEIKDKMKDNKEVLRLANTLLKREENKKNITPSKIHDLHPVETDDKAKGDCIENNKLSSALQNKAKQEENKRQNEEAEKRRQREFQIKVEKELEEMNRAPRMTKEFIKNHCKQHKLYSTPYLNDILYLHFKGFSKIENLEEYTGLKCIFLENNGIQRIEGLDTLSELKCLYLHYNVLRKIENLHGCPKLDTLNIDHNFVTKIENLDVVPDLHTLSMGHNMLTSVDDLVHLRSCRNLSVVDLSYNRLEDPLIVDVLADMPILKVLVLTGNPVVRIIPAYRKTLTLRLKELLNLDNRPVFPRDRACAEAWQRGGVQEEIAERKRWIEREQEKVMQSVRYLIKMRDDNRAKREAREQEEREKLGLPPVVKKDEEDIEIREAEKKQEITAESDRVETKQGVIVDMLSGSEADDSTSGSSSDSDSDEKDDGQDGKTTKIEWSKVDSGERMIQELKEDQPNEDQWTGFMAGSSNFGDNKVVSDLNAINNLLFNQAPHTDKKKMPQILEERKNIPPSADAIMPETISESLTSGAAKRKPLIEIIKEYSKKSPMNNIVSENKDNEINRGMIEDGNLIIDVDKKVAFKKETINKFESIDKEKTNAIEHDHSNRKLKCISIKEVKEQKDTDDDNNKKTATGAKSEKGTDITKNDAKEDIKPITSSQSTKQTVYPSTSGQGDGDGVALINYMDRVKSNKVYDEGDPDLQPSAEDLEIFSELEKEELEKEARIARGEPAIDPMKLYDVKTMEAFHKAQEPEHAHALTKKNFVTTYKTDNAFDRAALSQLTAGEKPDEDKMKLTHVPGAVLLQYVDKQTPTEVNYEIGKEEIESGTSSPDTDSVNISSDTDTSSSESEQSAGNTKRRPTTAKSNGQKDCTAGAIKSNTDVGNKRSTDSNENDNSECDDDDVKVNKAREESFFHHRRRISNVCCSSKDLMSNVDRSDAKRCIVDTINSYGDDRFPSQGVNYSNMAENARVEDSVATEILNKTLKYEEQELYRQIDVVTSHASRVDNQTNAIIEQISDELQHECSLPEVSRILEAHVEDVEHRLRAEMYENYVPSPDDSSDDDSSDDNEATLIPSHDSSGLEDTFTEDYDMQRAVGAGANDSGFCNEDNHNAISVDDVKSDRGKEYKKKLRKDESGDKNKSNDGNNFLCHVETGASYDESDYKNAKGDVHANISAEDEIFEDCVADIDPTNARIEKDANANPVEEKYTLEMKLALEMKM
ncbi:uncharacterized protein LOC120634232 [Pararge aegeria]|uniref:uncharacterized protein LOC120634232 n=1 Tax=Pararge aegeria TaxID=116150 RepID=UPI0019D18389|nr:uncharacterized protein LOC120634232 [Pararge aegeria]